MIKCLIICISEANDVKYLILKFYKVGTNISNAVF